MFINGARLATKTVTMAPDGGTRHHCNQHEISAGTGELSADA